MNKLSKFEIIEQSFKLIQKKGWNDYSLEKVATEYKYKINDVKSLIKNKDNLLFEFSKMINERVESNIDINDFNDSDIKDNLFELLMMRFDIMNSYKKALKRIINEVKNPIILKKISHNILESMDFYLEFSNAYDRSVFDFFKKKSLFLIYSYCFKIWLEDDTEELSKTMSELDRLLNYAERFSKKAREFYLF